MRAGYETTDYLDTQMPGELRGRETMTERRRYSDIGRPRGAGRNPDAATREAHGDWLDELAKMKARLEQLG